MSDAPLRLAITSYYLPSESKIGAGWVSHRLANALVGLGHDVTMFSPCRRPDDAKYAHQHIEQRGRFRTFRWAWEVRRLDLSTFDGLLAQGDDHLVRRSAVRAHVRTLHGSCFDEALHVPGVKEKLRMLALGLIELVAAIRVPVVVGVSRASLRYFPWLHLVIPNGVDVQRFRPDPTVGKEPRPTILFVGTFGNRKRGWLLHETFQQYVSPRVPDAQLWMVCDDAPLAPGVEVLGRLSDEELADRYRRAWVFCLPSSYEGFGVPYVEAMVSGTAVVATPNAGAREVLEGGAAGVIADVPDLGRELVRLLMDADERHRFEQAGLDRRGRYDFEVVAGQYIQLIRDQLAGRTP